MVEELKLAIKVDDDAIEQSLLKQFANAEKMANKVVLTFNNIDLDDKAIEAKFKEMQKIAGKNPIDLSIDKNSIEMLSAISKQLGNIFDIAKGKSIIDSSAIDNDSIQTAISLFEKMESSIAKIRKVFADVGDGEEFSPLLKMINNVQSSISELATSVKGIGLNMNIDVGSDSEMEAKVQSKIANALQAYQRLFDAIKMSGSGGSVINTNFFEFDINQYDTMMGKLQAYKKFIDNMRKEAKTQFNGKDVLYQDTEKSYWTQASAAMGQVTKAFNEMKVASDTNPLKDLFGSGDLSEVISQLGLIVAKLEEISTTASSFKNVFKEGFNVTASVEEIDKLTNRVKELEDELSKIKLNPVSVDKSNISSENSIVESQNKIQEELKETENTIIRVYRAYNKMSGMVGEAGISWFSDDLDTMKTYMNHYKDRELVSGDIDINKLLSIDAQGSKHNAITYLGDYSDEASIKITDLYNKIQQLKSELSKAPNDALAQQLKELELEYDKLSEDTSNLYGTHTTNWFAIQAKEAGYLGIAIKNVVDDYDGLIDKPTTTIALFDTNLLENQEKITSRIRENVENIKGLNFDVSKAVETDANSFVNNISPEDLNDEIREIQEFNSLMKLTQMTSEELGSSLREVFSYAHENPDVLDNLYDYNPNLVDVFDKNTNIGKYFDELVSSTNWDVDESSLESIYLDFAKKLQDYEIKYIESVKQKLNIISNNIQSDNTSTEETISSNNSIQNELKETQEQAEQTAKAVQDVSETQIEDVFQGGTTSAEKLEEEIKNIDSATEKASESAKEYRKILSQVGEFDIDSKVSAMYKRNDGQLESWTWRVKKDDEGNVLYDQNGKIDYDEPTITVISKYEQLEKIIVKADNELRNLQKDLAEIKAYDPTASTTNIEAKISDQKEYIRLLEQTVKAISQSDEYLLDEQQIIEVRNKAAREYALTTGAKQEKTDAKQSASDEKKRLANIEQVNRALNKQQITIDAIEKTYNKTTNPDLDREVSNQQDLAELAQKKLAIQTKINSLQGQERNSANEKEFLELEKLIAEYKELAKYKLKANNPSKQELGGQNLQTLIQVQISNYDKLITKAEKYGDATSDTVEKLKEQRDILSKIGSDGKYSATADQYYASRDTYKVESAALSAFEVETKAAEQEAKAVKEVWDKNVKAIQDYMDAVTKLNNLNAKDKGTGKYSSQIALQEKNVEELKEKALEARTAITSMINPHDVPLNTWRDYLDVMKKFDQASLGSAESVAKLEDALRKMDFSSLESAGTKFESQFNNLSIKPDGDHQFLSWINDLKELNAKIDEYNSKVKYLKENNIVDGEQVKEVKELRDEIKETINVMTKTPQAKRGWTDIGASKAAEKVANVLKQNTKMSKEAKDAIRAYYNELRSGNPSQPIDEILVKVNQLVQKERELGRVGKSFGEIFKEKVIYGGAAQLAGMVGFYDVINVGREIVTNIKEVDTALTELRKVSDATEQRLTTNFKNSADTAKELGATVSDVISATADWSRMGYNIDQAEELARVSTLYKNVGDGIDIETANNSLISTLQGFQLDASQAESIIDKFNEVANNYAIDSAGIGEALQRSAASFNAANTDLSKSIALITATNEVVQDPDSVGTLWKTMSARIRGAETELSELGEETDEYTKTTSKLRDLIQSLTGFDIMIDEDTFKDVYEIILGIGKEWDNLTDAEQASLGEALAGKRNANALYAVLGNLDTLQSAYETAEESAGKQNYLNI